MTHRKRTYCRLALALVAPGIAWSVAAQPTSTSSEPALSPSKGQAYPARPIRLVVAQSTGGSEALGSTPREAAQHISAEIARYTKLTKAIGLKVD